MIVHMLILILKLYVGYKTWDKDISVPYQILVVIFHGMEVLRLQLNEAMDELRLLQNKL